MRLIVKRYQGQDAVAELGEEASQIRNKTATILGLGGVGSAVAESLARMGVNLRIIDRDRVLEEDLPRLSLFGEEHIGKFKAKEAKKLLEALNKDIKVKAFHEDIVEHNAYLVEADVIIECSGSLDTALLADKAAKKKPLIYARAKDVEGHIFISDETRLKQIKGFLEKQEPSHERIILNTTTQLISALATNKALKILTGQRHEKNYLVVNGWKFSCEKLTVRKDKK